MADLGFLRGEVVRDLGLSMNTAKKMTQEREVGEKQQQKKYEEETKNPNVEFEEQWRKT